MAGPWLHDCSNGERAHRPVGCLSDACGWFTRRCSDLSPSGLLSLKPRCRTPSCWRVHLLQRSGLNITNLEGMVLEQEIVGFCRLWSSLYTGQIWSVSICSLYVVFIKTIDRRCWFLNQSLNYCFELYQMPSAFYRSHYNNVHNDGISWFFKAIFKVILCLLGC